MSKSEITAWLATKQDAMVAMLREMVDIDSGSYNKPVIDAVGDAGRRFMAGHGIPVETVAQQKHGDCLRALRSSRMLFSAFLQAYNLPGLSCKTPINERPPPSKRVTII